MFRKVQWGAFVAALSMAVCASNAAADTIYPAGGSKFPTDTQGWSATENSCSLLVIPSTLCTVTSEWTGARGAPQETPPFAASTGALASRYTSTVGLLGLLTGRSVWRSPDFVVSPGANSPATLSFKRATELAGLINQGGQAATQVVLVDKTAVPQTRTELYGEPITVNDGNFGFQQVAVPQGLLRQGRTYALEFETEFTSTVLQALEGGASVFYDDIRLVVPDGTDAGTVAPTVQTLNATALTATSAQLQGLVNPKGSPTEALFDFGETAAYGQTISVGQIGEGTGNVPTTTQVTNLTKCTTYHYRATARNAIGTSLGQDLTFTTDCQPSATTLAASPVGAQGAVLNGSVTANGPETTYFYEYGKDTTYGSRTTGRVSGSGREAKQPLSEPITGLDPNTVYHARIIAGNALGVTVGNDVEFKTPPLTGPAGATGTPGAPGAPGAPGRPATGGSTSGQSNTVTTVRNGDARALLTIRSKIARVGLLGKRAGQIRLPIFCKQETGRSCAGTVKLRSRVRINPSSKPGKKKKARLVTLATFEYQLAAGKKGFAIATIQPEKLDLMRLRKTVKINISVQVTDSRNNRQTIVQAGTMKAQKTV